VEQIIYLISKSICLF